MKTHNTSPLTGALECLNSRADLYGNRYFALRFTETGTGRTVCGTVSGGESNVKSLIWEANGGNWEIHLHGQRPHQGRYRQENWQCVDSWDQR